MTIIYMYIYIYIYIYIIIIISISIIIILYIYIYTHTKAKTLKISEISGQPWECLLGGCLWGSCSEHLRRISKIRKFRFETKIIMILENETRSSALGSWGCDTAGVCNPRFIVLRAQKLKCAFSLLLLSVLAGDGARSGVVGH